MAYARHKQPIVVRHLFFDQEDSAAAAYARLQSGRSFLQEAQDCYQTQAFDSSAGFLGRISYFQTDDAFAEAAFALEVGDISAPVRSRQGYHIIRVEDRLAAPVLTESEFQTRKVGIASLLRLRRRRLSGDRFVRTFMDGLNVEVHGRHIAALKRALLRIERRAADDIVSSLDESESAVALDPGSVLARYTYNGEEYIFTAADYFFWFPDLPFAEATSRTAASVGRALRNEVLAMSGEAEGLASSSVVRRGKEVERVAFVAGRARMQGLDSMLLANASLDPSVAQVDSALFLELMGW